MSSIDLLPIASEVGSESAAQHASQAETMSSTIANREDPEIATRTRLGSSSSGSAVLGSESQ